LGLNSSQPRFAFLFFFTAFLPDCLVFFPAALTGDFHFFAARFFADFFAVFLGGFRAGAVLVRIAARVLAFLLEPIQKVWIQEQ
jgi:hypothetical protein